MVTFLKAHIVQNNTFRVIINHSLSGEIYLHIKMKHFSPIALLSFLFSTQIKKILPVRPTKIYEFNYAIILL